MVENEFDNLSSIFDELIDELDGTPYAAYSKQLQEKHDTIVKLGRNAIQSESLLDKNRAEKQKLKKTNLADEEHRLVSDRIRQLLGWERQ